MKTKTTICKECNSQIWANSPFCPECGTPLKTKKYTPVIILTIINIILTVYLLLRILFPNFSIPYYKTSAAPTGTFTVGEHVQTEKAFIKLNSVSLSSGSVFATAKNGNIFVLCDFTIANNSNSDISIDPWANFSAYADAYLINASIDAMTMEYSLDQLIGTIGPGKIMNGVLGFEVDEDWQKLEIKFLPDLSSKNEVTYVINKEQAKITN